MVKATSVKEETKNPVTASSAALVANQDNVARITLQIGGCPKSNEFVLPLLLKIEGADFRSIAPIGATTITNKGVPLKCESVVTLELGNLTPASLVTLTTIDSNKKIRLSASRLR